MNIPNSLTLGRLVVVPLVVWLIITHEMQAAFLLFLLQNTEEVRISFTFIEVRAPLWLAIAVAGLLGLVAGWLMGRFELGKGRMNKQR